MRRDRDSADQAKLAVPSAPALAASYEDWLGYLRKLERTEPYEAPELQDARRVARAIVRQKHGFGPKLKSNSFKAFDFDRCRRDRESDDPS